MRWATTFCRVSVKNYLLPPALQDWLPEGDLAWFILDAVAQMNLAAITRTYRADGWGQAAYEPAMMVALLLYAYCLGERSSRRIERLCQRDVAFRVITANQGPDHTTMARFRQTHEIELAKLFTQVLRLCAEAGLVKVGVVALDGTKIKAHAALAANRTVETITAEVSRMLTEAQVTDAAENRQYGPEQCGDELPEGLRIGKPAGSVAGLPGTVDAGSGHGHRAAAGQDRDAAGRGGRHWAKKRGRKPKAPEAAADRDAKANVTDPDSRIMKTQAGYVQGYNAQAVVTEDQIIVAAEVTQEENDIKQLHPMLERAQANLRAIAYPHAVGTALADAGYCSEANLLAATGRARPVDRHEQGLETAPGAAGAAAATRPLSEGADGPRPHGAHVADEAWSSPLQEARPDRGAGVRTNQEYPGL